jgi:hypothetical protein
MNWKKVNMSIEQELIDTLKNTIAVQKDLIDHLKREVHRLNTAPVYFQPLPQAQPHFSISPYIPDSPNGPYVTPNAPIYPCPQGGQLIVNLTGDVTIDSNSTTTAIIADTTNTLHPGSIQT